MIFELMNAEKHDRTSFDCGVPALNRYLQNFANQDQKRGLAKTYVLADQANILGYFSISAHAVPSDELPPQLNPRAYHELPFLLLGRLAVDLRYQGHGYGDALILHAFKTTAVIADKVGVLGMIVDAKDENAAHFYEKFGFMRLLGTSQRLVLPFSVIKRLLGV